MVKKNKIQINKAKGKSHIMYLNVKGGLNKIEAINDIYPTLMYKYLGVYL